MIQMPTVPTLMAATTVPVTMATQEMDSPAVSVYTLQTCIRSPNLPHTRMYVHTFFGYVHVHTYICFVQTLSMSIWYMV